MIASMAECSGDFMKRRVLKEVLPKLQILLKKQADVSLKAGPIYTQSQAYKLQLAALEGLGRLCKQLDVREQHLYGVACMCCLYLSSRQPVGFQKVRTCQIRQTISSFNVIYLGLPIIYCVQLYSTQGWQNTRKHDTKHSASQHFLRVRKVMLLCTIYVDLLII